MKFKSKKTISPLPETFTKIKPNTLNPYEIKSAGGTEERISDFLPLVNGDDTILPDPEVIAGPTGPAGPQGPPGEGISGGVSGGFVWDSTEPTTATNLEGVPQGTTFPIGTSSIEVLKSILYPRFLEFSDFTIGINLGPYHIGDDTSSGTYISSWTIQDVDEAQENSLRIFQGSTSLIEGYSLTSASDIDGNTADILHPSYSRTSEGNVTFTVSLTSNNGNTISDTESIRWNYPLYTGKTSATELTSYSDFLSLGAISTSNPHISYTLSQMKTGITKQYSATSNPEYLFWVIPKSVDSSTISGYPVYSSNSSFTDITNPNTTQSVPVQKQSSSVTFPNYGLSIEFDVYRTVVAFANARTIRVAE